MHWDQYWERLQVRTSSLMSACSLFTVASRVKTMFLAIRLLVWSTLPFAGNVKVSSLFLRVNSPLGFIALLLKCKRDFKSNSKSIVTVFQTD